LTSLVYRLSAYVEANLSSTPRLFGKSPNGWQRTSSTGCSAPSHGSHVTALIAFLAVTGREYHCPHCLLSPYRELPDSLRNSFSLRARKSGTGQIKLLCPDTFTGTSRRSF